MTTKAYIIIIILLFVFPLYVKAENDTKVDVIVVFKEKADKKIILKYEGKIKYVYQIIPGISAKIPLKNLSELQKEPSVKYVQINEAIRIQQEIQWNMYRIGAPAAWSIGGTTGEHLIQVAVLDTGIDGTHEDLSANVVWCYVATDEVLPDPCFDNNGHGTHVAGIIGALLNGIGVAGVAPSIALYSIKVCTGGGLCFIDDIVEGIDQAVRGPDGIIDRDGDGQVAGDPDDDAADVTNMSFGGPGPYPAMYDAIISAYNYGLIQVAAAGNNGEAGLLEPGKYPEVIAMGATDINDNVADFSSRGPELDFSAPGVNVLSTLPFNQYGEASGTSMASPHGAGAVALIQAARLKHGLSFMDFNRIYNLLAETADDILDPGWDRVSGYGIIRVDKAMQIAVIPEERHTVVISYPTVTYTEYVLANTTKTYINTNTVAEELTVYNYQTNTITKTTQVTQRFLIPQLEKVSVTDYLSLILFAVLGMVLGAGLGILLRRVR
jgi:subtilisin family serine protease